MFFFYLQESKKVLTEETEKSRLTSDKMGNVADEVPKYMKLSDDDIQRRFALF